MLPCVCSVIDHRWRQNVVRTKKWHTRRHWCSYHILTYSVIYYWIRRTATWNLFVLYNNEKIFQHNAIAGLLPRLCTKIAIWRDLWSIQNEAISLVAMRSKELWLVAENRATVKPDSVTPRWMKAELNCEIYKSWRKCWKNLVGFRHRSSPVNRKTLDVALKITGVEKIPSENFWPRGHLIRVLNERSVNDCGDFCLLWLVILKSAWYSAGDTLTAILLTVSCG